MTNHTHRDQPVTSFVPAHLTDQNLYHLCITYGARALEWRRKFIGLLPEVNRRKLFERKGFESIFVFAKKLAGLSEEQVRRVLNLEERFNTMPGLQRLLINGEVSMNKLVRVASIANTENEKFLVENLKVLSKSAVETLVRDEKFVRAENSDIRVSLNEGQNGLFEAKVESESVPGHRSRRVDFIKSNGRISAENLCRSQALNLSPEVHSKLLELQQKGLNLNQLLLEFLRKREAEIAWKKEEVSRKVLRREEQKIQKTEEISEYILKNPLKTYRPGLPASVKKILQEEYGEKCAIGHCHKPAENIHHTLPFSISRSHDPRFLIPLCKEHHELQHIVNCRYQVTKIGIIDDG